MRLSSSTQPTSTIRSPLFGSRPVVSVSRTISRMDALFPIRWRRDNLQDITHLRTGVIETLRGIHHEIGTAAFFCVRYLLGDDGLELLFRHSGPRQSALTLHPGRRRYHHDGIASPFAPGLIEQRNIQYGDRRPALFRVAEELVAR